MRKLVVVVATAALLASLTGTAQAKGGGGGGGEPGTEQYDSFSLYGSWSTERSSSGGEYIRITWYVDAYQATEVGQTDPEFWSTVSRQKERCIKRPGRDRCRFLFYEYGSIRHVGDGSFTVNADLTAGTIEATYRLKFVDEERVDHPRTVRFLANFKGSGQTYRTTEEYTNYEGDCLLFEYSAEYTNRESEASADLDGRDLGWIGDAYLSSGHSVSTQYECPGS